MTTKVKRNATKKPAGYRCIECQVGTVLPTKRAGRRTRYRMLEIDVPANLTIETCDNCGAEYINADGAAEQDAALEPVYRAEMRRLVTVAIATLTPHVKESALEAMLGLSRGYLSRVRNGSKDPSPDLVVSLTMLAKDPRRRLREIEQLWSAPSSDRR